MRKKVKVEEFEAVEAVPSRCRFSGPVLAVMCTVVMVLAGVSLLVSYLTNKQMEDSFEDYFI